MGRGGRIISAYSGVGAAAGFLLFALGTRPGAAQANESEPHAFTLSGDYVGTHDPSIMKAGDMWYVFATGRAPQGQMAIRCSKDLHEWRLCGHVIDVIPGMDPKGESRDEGPLGSGHLLLQREVSPLLRVFDLW